MIIGVALAVHQIKSANAASRAPTGAHTALAAVPIARFARACAGHLVAGDHVLLLDAGYGYGTLTMDGYDDWNAAEYVYNLLPVRVLIAPNVEQARSLLQTARPQYLAIWLQAGKRETASLRLPEYASAVKASSAFQLVLTYSDPGGDVGLLFAVR